MAKTLGRARLAHPGLQAEGEKEVRVCESTEEEAQSEAVKYYYFFLQQQQQQQHHFFLVKCLTCLEKNRAIGSVAALSKTMMQQRCSETSTPPHLSLYEVRNI